MRRHPIYHDADGDSGHAGFYFRAQISEAEGNIDGAIADRLTCVKLGCLMQKGSYNFVEFLVGVAVEALWQDISIASNPDAQPTVKQWEPVAKYASWSERDVALSRALEGKCTGCLSTIMMFVNCPIAEILEYSNEYSAGSILNYLSIDLNVLACRERSETGICHASLSV